MAPRRFNPFIVGGALTRIASAEAPSISSNSELAYRSALIERSAINQESRSIEFTFSSNAELERWPGVVEVLSHAPGAVDLTRLLNGAQLLFNHDPDEYIGVVESATIGADGKGRCVVRFSENDDAEEVWKDVKAGILRNVSVGYRIREVKLTEERDGLDIYTVMRWEPYEVSIVTIPADVSIGIGRDMRSLFQKSNQKISHTNNAMNRAQLIQFLQSRGISFDSAASDTQLADLVTRNLHTPVVGSIQVGTEGGQSASAERERASAILAAGRQYNQTALAQRAVEDGTSVEGFRNILINELDSRNRSIVDGTRPIGMSENEARSFSFMKLFRALSEPQDQKLIEAAKFEFEACETAGKQITHRTLHGTAIPTDVLLTPLVGNGQRGDIVSIKTGSGYTGTGGNTVQTQLLSGSFIDLLRNRSVLMGLGTEMGGLVGNIDIPKQMAGSTAYWIGEDVDATREDLDFGLVQLNPKTVANLGEVTRKALMQSSLSIEALFRGDLARGLTQEIDRAGFYGLAASNQPRGLKLLSGINTADWAADNSPTYAEIVAMETAIAADNADIPSMAYVFNAVMRGYLKTTEKFSGTTGATIWEPGNTVNGYRTEVTNQIATGDIFFGNFADLLIGLWGGLDITVDPYTHSAKGRIRYTAFQDVDFAHRRAESFCYNKNAE